MSNDMWQQHLFSKRARNLNDPGTVDGFHDLTNGPPVNWTSSIGNVIRQENSLGAEQRAQGKPYVFMQDCGTHFYMGVAGLVKDSLGEESPYAYEEKRDKEGAYIKGRRFSFTHGYFAPKGTLIPDLEELLKRQPADLEDLLRRANGGEDKIEASASFTQSRKKGTEWDRLATEFEQGKHPLQGATFSQTGEFLTMMEAPEKDGRDSANDPSASDKANLGANLKANALPAGAGAAAAIAGGLLVAKGLFGKHKEEAPSSTGEKPKGRFWIKLGTCALGATISLLGVGAAVYAGRGGNAAKPEAMSLLQFVVKGPGRSV